MNLELEPNLEEILELEPEFLKIKVFWGKTIWNHGLINS